MLVLSLAQAATVPSQVNAHVSHLSLKREASAHRRRR
jgi:hypothetical protein